jgi:hypothetical protein
MGVAKAKDSEKGRNAFTLSFFMPKNKIAHSSSKNFLATM